MIITAVSIFYCSVNISAGRFFSFSYTQRLNWSVASFYQMDDSRDIFWRRLILGLRACRLEHLRYLVIDEADRMVEQGHFQELSSILELIQRKRQWTSISIGASISFRLLFLKLMVFMTVNL